MEPVLISIHTVKEATETNCKQASGTLHDLRDGNTQLGFLMQVLFGRCNFKALHSSLTLNGGHYVRSTQRRGGIIFTITLCRVGCIDLQLKWLLLYKQLAESAENPAH